MAKQLAKYGIEALKPQLVNGGWHKPRISGRVAAKLKKTFEQEGKWVIFCDAQITIPEVCLSYKADHKTAFDSLKVQTNER